MDREPHDPTKLLRYVARHALTGVIAGWVVLLGLLWMDIGGLGTRVAASPDRELITIMLAEMFSVIIVHSLDLDEATAKTFSASNILKIAEERLVESGWRVQARVNAAIDDTELEVQRQMDGQP